MDRCIVSAPSSYLLVIRTGPFLPRTRTSILLLPELSWCRRLIVYSKFTEIYRYFGWWQYQKNGKGEGRNLTEQSKRAAIDYLLLDAFYLPNTNGIPKSRQLAIVKGDQKSFSIASASIIAKVYRDKLMQSLSNKSMYKKYQWNKNKGYGTIFHREIIVKFGQTKYHRTQFIATYLSKANDKRLTTSD